MGFYAILYQHFDAIILPEKYEVLQNDHDWYSSDSPCLLSKFNIFFKKRIIPFFIKITYKASFFSHVAFNHTYFQVMYLDILYQPLFHT
uniref:Uncharacterized protein n=1 Tax=Lysinibacillus sphaericus TaxID=1421 RepID=B5A905_LYSSH|nr:unknown [Lysinibacillus sphaericus]